MIVNAYRNDHCSRRVWLDGEEVTHDCYYADDERGEVRLYPKDEHGQTTYDPDTDTILTERKYGVVRVEIPPDDYWKGNKRVWRRVPLNTPRRFIEAGIDEREITKPGDTDRRYEVTGRWARVCIPIPVCVARAWFNAKYWAVKSWARAWA